MKKSKFILLSLILIVLLGFSLFFVPVGVMGVSDNELDIDIEEFWVGIGLPLSAMHYYDEDGKGIRFYTSAIFDYEFEGTIINYFILNSVDDYYFDDGTIDIYQYYTIFLQFCSESLVSMFDYYYDTYGFGPIPDFDKISIIWDVDQQMFVVPDYLSYWIDTSYNEGYEEGYDVGYGEGYDVGNEDGYNEGYQEGITVNHEAAYYAGYDTGYDAGYEIGYDDARPEMDILLITLIMFILSVFVYFKFRLRWVLIATALLWFVPIFLVENLFIKIFSVIMIIVTIVITFFNEREDEY